MRSVTSYGVIRPLSISSRHFETVQTIQAATDHEWFVMRGDVVAIAVHETGDVESRDEEIRSSEEESRKILRSLFSSADRDLER